VEYKKAQNDTVKGYEKAGPKIVFSNTKCAVLGTGECVAGIYFMCSRILAIMSSATDFKYKCGNLVSLCTVSEVQYPTSTLETSAVVHTGLFT
jgi:hypothetical protein